MLLRTALSFDLAPVLRCSGSHTVFSEYSKPLFFCRSFSWAWLRENSHARQLLSVCFLGSARQFPQPNRTLCDFNHRLAIVTPVNPNPVRAPLSTFVASVCRKTTCSSNPLID